MLRHHLILAALAISRAVADDSSSSTHYNTLDGGYQYLTELYNTLDGGYQWLTDITDSATLKDGKVTQYKTQSFTASNTNELTVATTTSTISGSAVVTTRPEYLSWVTVTPTANGGGAAAAVIAGVVIVPAMFEALQGVVDVSAGKSAVEIAEAIKNALEGKKITLTPEDLQTLSEYIKNAMVSAAAIGAVYKIGPFLKGATVPVIGGNHGATTTSDSGPVITAIMKPPYDNWQALKNLPEPQGQIPMTADGSTETQPICERKGDSGNLGIDPAVVNQLAKKFCGSMDQTKDASASLGGAALTPPSTTLENHAAFKFTHTDGECAKSCEDNYAQLIKQCQYTSHAFNGNANVTDACGTFSVEIAKGPGDGDNNNDDNKPPTTRQEWDFKCTDQSNHAKFSLDAVTTNIDAFCASGVQLLEAAQKISHDYPTDGATIHLFTQWSQSGQDGCAAYDASKTSLTKEECTAGFLKAASCNTDSGADKYGSMPATWSGPKGCVDFNVYAESS